MAKITRIKASDPGKSTSGEPPKPKSDKKASEKALKAPEKATKAKAPSDSASVKKAEGTAKKSEKSAKKPFILIRSLVYFGRYIRDSWREIRQVRWPSRKSAWKLFFAIVLYTLLFVAVIMLLDALFTWLFETVLG